MPIELPVRLDLPESCGTAVLDTRGLRLYTQCMAHDFLIYDFGTDEETAQQARHKVDSWAQGFRLGKKILLKFERENPSSEEGTKKPEKGNKATVAKAVKVRAFVRLDFSSHEKLSHQRWLERIPTEEPFKSAKGKVVRPGDPAHGETAETFEKLV
jgi:hypothetical protein